MSERSSYGSAVIRDGCVIIQDYYDADSVKLNVHDAVKLVAILLKFIAEEAA